MFSLAENGRAATNAELSERVRLHPTTTFRMLESLKVQGLVRQLPDASYDLGPAALDLGNAFLRRISISRHANDIAEALSVAVDETASVGVLDEGKVLYVAVANGQSHLGIQSVPFGRHPIYCTALGKALVSESPWEETAEILKRGPMERLTTRTITSPEEYRIELGRTKERGYAIDDQERTPGVICIAAPIRDFSGRIVAALSMSGADFRILGRGIDACAEAVCEVAEKASERLGYSQAASAATKTARGPS